MALYSSLTDKVIGDDIIFMGEIGLAGELRSIPNARQRIAECERMGFKRCVVPAYSVKGLDLKEFGIDVIGVRSIRDCTKMI